MATVTSLTFTMGKRRLKSTSRRQLHYTAEGFDWTPLFERLDDASSPLSIRALAAEQGLPHTTLGRHYRDYQAGLANDDHVKVAVATGEIDGRRDNARKFSRAEERTLLEVLDKENVAPNKPHIQLLATRIHEEKKAHDSPAKSTRLQTGPATPFVAGGSFVHRIKTTYNFNDHKPKLVKRHKKKKNRTAEEEDALTAIFREQVVQAVGKVGGALTINADEISGKSLIKPRTLWHLTGGPPPLLESNNTGKEAFTMILATTAAGHKLKPAVFVKGKTDRALKAWRHLADKVHLNLVDNRWVDQEMWDWYVETVIVAYSKHNPCAFVVDSHGPHISAFAGDVYAHHLITSVQVPAGMTGRLQPNDVGVYGPLTQIVGRLWLEQKREAPDEWDSMVHAVERYLAGWTELDRGTVRAAWVQAVPKLGSLVEEVRHTSV
jgi:hypothetical protein